MHNISSAILLLIGITLSGESISLSGANVSLVPMINKSPQNLIEDKTQTIIRELRAASNRAIAAKDTAGISRLWTQDFHMISSRNTEVSGRKANQLNFAKEFKNRPDVVYIRTPAKIEVNETWNMAAEHGEWVGTWTDSNDKIEVRGTYFAKWHRLNGQWLIRAELYVPLQCKGGGFCATSPL